MFFFVSYLTYYKWVNSAEMRDWILWIIEYKNNDLYIFTLITIVHLYLQNSAKCYYTVVIKLILKLFQMKKSFASYYKSLATEKEKKKYWCCWRLGKNRMHIFNLNENLILGCQVWKWNPATNQTRINPMMKYLTFKKHLNLKVKHIYFFIVISIRICKCKLTMIIVLKWIDLQFLHEPQTILIYTSLEFQESARYKSFYFEKNVSNEDYSNIFGVDFLCKIRPSGPRPRPCPRPCTCTWGRCSRSAPARQCQPGGVRGRGHRWQNHGGDERNEGYQ